MFRFIHAADIHLDSPLLGLEKYEGAPAEEIRGATRKALENLVAVAIREKVDFVLIAGDLYDGEWKDAGTGLFFVRQTVRLREAGIPVFVISGNHDAQNKMTKELRFPENVVFFPHAKPATRRIENLEVAIHGQSYARADVTENLAANYPAAIDGAFNIGLLHTCGPGGQGIPVLGAGPCAHGAGAERGSADGVSGQSAGAPYPRGRPAGMPAGAGGRAAQCYAHVRALGRDAVGGVRGGCGGRGEPAGGDRPV
jgi:DNA repair exonuclease SbcCD nuclease subunit